MGHLLVPGTAGLQGCFVLHLLRSYLIFGASDVLFFGCVFWGPLMYRFDLCGMAVRLGFSSTTNVRLKIILSALKRLHLMFTILLCF